MELLVYKASAGSGKTFTLAVEYITRLLENPTAYREILAVTFTNKATAEMKERIMQQLYGIWQAHPASQPYLDNIMQKLKAPAGSEDKLRQQAGKALLCLLHDYSRFRVETIDSFFQSVMRNLARELDLSPNLNIELNNQEVLSDAVDSLIENLEPNSPVMAWLMEYITDRINNDKKWNVANELKSFGRNIFDESYIERGEVLRAKMRNPEMMKLYRDALQELMAQALDQMKGFATRFEEELEGHQLSTDDLANKQRGIASYFNKLKNGKLSDKDIVNETLKKCLDSPDNWVTKSGANRTQTLRLVQDSLFQLLQEAEQMRPSRCRTVNSCRLSLGQLYQLQLLNHIDQEVKQLNYEHNRFLLSDTNALLHQLMREGDSSFVFEKIGATLRTVMIDEFQDTSRLQWDNFRLLLLEGLAQGADSLIVGDVKQSIYRWRNGDWGILNNLRDNRYGQPKDANQGLEHIPVRVETLKTNRRSQSNIIGFNNHFFEAAVDALNTQHVNELGEECHPLKDAYADVVQESPRKVEKGYVCATFLDDKDNEEEDYITRTLQDMGTRVQVLMEQGIALTDIAILVRKNKNIPLIADYFDRTFHIPVVSDEAFRFDASQAVNLLIDALRVLNNPADTVAVASIAKAYSTSGNEVLRSAHPEEWLPAEFKDRSAELRLMPLYELFEELYRLFHLERIEKQDAYLFAFFDAVTEYLQKNSSQLDTFIAYWEQTLCSKTIAGGEPEGIRILSIHKSKGLEFHTVLIPFCDWKLENETNNQLVWCTAPTKPYNALDLIPVNYSSVMAESVFRADYLHERLQLWVDNLNLLYVAFTRAGSNLLIWSKQGKAGSMSQLLQKSLDTMAQKGWGQWNDEQTLYETGTLCPSEPKKENDAAAVVNKLCTPARKLPVKMQSLVYTVEFRQSNRSADFIAGIDESESRSRFINRGLLLHTLFSAIGTPNDIDDAIDRLVFDGIIGEQTEEQEIRQLTRTAFQNPQAQKWYDGSWRLFNECDIVWQEGGETQNRRPDRVMMRDDEIVIIDFKFGKPNPLYNRQVEEYMELIGQMGYTHSIRGYLWYITPNGKSAQENYIEEVLRLHTETDIAEQN